MKTDFAKRIGKTYPDHASKLGAMQAALRALGKTLVITINEAA